MSETKEPTTFPISSTAQRDPSPVDNLAELFAAYNAIKRGRGDSFEKMEARLRELHDAFNQQQSLYVGAIVKWKDGLKNRKLPDYNQPAIVIKVLRDYLTDSTLDSGSTYFGEKLDIVLGVLGPENDFLFYHYDSRRFEIAKKLAGTK